MHQFQLSLFWQQMSVAGMTYWYKIPAQWVATCQGHVYKYSRLQ